MIDSLTYAKFQAVVRKLWSTALYLYLRKAVRKVSRRLKARRLRRRVVGRCMDGSLGGCLNCLLELTFRYRKERILMELACMHSFGLGSRTAL